jgi:hypothetical protein
LTEQDIAEGEGIKEYNDVDQEEEEGVVVKNHVEEEKNNESDLTELDIEEGEGLEEYENVDGEEEKEDNEEELVSSRDMEHSIIVVAPRC